VEAPVPHSRTYDAPRREKIVRRRPEYRGAPNLLLRLSSTWHGWWAEDVPATPFVSDGLWKDHRLVLPAVRRLGFPKRLLQGWLYPESAPRAFLTRSRLRRFGGASNRHWGLRQLPVSSRWLHSPVNQSCVPCREVSVWEQLYRSEDVDPAMEDPRRFRAVIFDFDGTLADSYAAITASVNHVRASYGLPQLAQS